MTGGHSSGGGPAHPEADECVRAGMYWFGRGDVTAAEAWWRRALELEPGHAQARECMYLLQREVTAEAVGPASPDRAPDVQADRAAPLWGAEAVGPASPDRAPHVQADRAAPLWGAEAVGPASPDRAPHDRVPQSLLAPAQMAVPEMRPVIAVSEPSMDIRVMPWAAAAGPHGFFDEDDVASVDDGQSALDPSAFGDTLPPPRYTSPSGVEPAPLAVVGAPVASLAAVLPPVSVPPSAAAFSAVTVPATVAAPAPPGPFGAPGRGGAPAPAAEAAESVANPWDDGPSRTSVVTLEDDPTQSSGHTPIPGVEFDDGFAMASPSSLPFGQEDDVIRPEATSTASSVPSARPFSRQAPAVSWAPRQTPLQAAPPPIEDITITDPVEMSMDLPTDKPRTPERTLRDAKKRFQLHDFVGASELLEKVLEDEPEHPEARRLLVEASANLMKMYESKLGGLERVPRVQMSSEELIWLNLNHRAGFILSQIDGTLTYDDLIALSGMPRLDTLKILAGLIQDRVIGSD